MYELEMILGKVARNAFFVGFGLGVVFILVAALLGFGIVSLIH